VSALRAARLSTPLLIQIARSDAKTAAAAAAHSGGGLPAHNYWDNENFCKQAAVLIAAS